MQIVIGILGVLGCAVIIIFTSSVNMNGWVRGAIIGLLVLLAVYGRARRQPEEAKPEKIAKPLPQPSAVAAYAQERESAHG